MVGADSCRISRALQYLGYFFSPALSFRLRACHPLRLLVPEHSTKITVWFETITSRQKVPRPSHCNGWFLTQCEFLAVPVSLTTTQGITFVFFSSRYLDVSVHAVVFLTLYIQIRIPGLHPGGFSHSEILGSMLGWQLPEAYSSLLLPSSTSDAIGIHRTPFSIIYKLLIPVLIFYPKIITIYFKDHKFSVSTQHDNKTNKIKIS